MRIEWAPSVLRAAGLTVKGVSGWTSRGSEFWGPIKGIICHATAGARKGSTSGEIGVLINGSTTAPPPIAQFYLARNGDWHIVASGRCNHALLGWAGALKGFGNTNLIGVEAGNDNRGETWPTVQLRSYERGVAALLRHLKLSARFAVAHREHQPWPDPVPGRGSTKSDPAGINMTTFRANVARIMTEEDTVALSDQEYDEIAKRVWGRINPTEDKSYAELLRIARSAAVESRDVGQVAVAKALALEAALGVLADTIGSINMGSTTTTLMTPVQFEELKSATVAAAQDRVKSISDALATAGDALSVLDDEPEPAPGG